jgi:Raf kinase inhibitor-like YbhB/YbcL family protein
MRWSRLAGMVAFGLAVACGNSPASQQDASPDRSPPASDAGREREPDAQAPTAEIDAAAGDAGPRGDAGSVPLDAGDRALTLASSGFLMQGKDLVFPASACAPQDQSPPFSWQWPPRGTKSFALTFVDEDNGATKWVVWNIPLSVMALPADLSKDTHPAEVPGASQLGSLGHSGYAGPGVPGPPMHTYSFVLWALDVAELPGTDGLSTKELRVDVLPVHAIAMSAELVAKGQAGGP